MKGNVLQYKGYLGSVEIVFEEGILHGKILYVKDLVTYEAETPTELEKEFRAAIDDYLETCATIGKQPDKAFKGSLNVRLGPDLHRNVAIQATIERVSINEFIKATVEEKISTGAKVQKYVYEHVIKTVLVEQAGSMSVEFGGTPWEVASHNEPSH